MTFIYISDIVSILVAILPLEAVPQVRGSGLDDQPALPLEGRPPVSSWGTRWTPLWARSSRRQSGPALYVVPYRARQTGSSWARSPWPREDSRTQGFPPGRSEPAGLGSAWTPGSPGTSGCEWGAGCCECDCSGDKWFTIASPLYNSTLNRLTVNCIRSTRSWGK